GLSQAREPRRGSLVDGDRAPSLLAHPGRRSLARARTGGRLARRDHRRRRRHLGPARHREVHRHGGRHPRRGDRSRGHRRRRQRRRRRPDARAGAARVRAAAGARSDGRPARGILDARPGRHRRRRRAPRADDAFRMIVLSGADLVLPDRVLGGGTLVLDGDRIVDVRPGADAAGDASSPHLHFPFAEHYIVPGFIDVHVHGVEGLDTLDLPPDGVSHDGAVSSIAGMAERLPRYGVTAFCPTTIACDPVALRRMLSNVRAARTQRPPAGARVLPAHLESNFINPDYKGAQPLECLRGVRPGSDPCLTPATPGAWTGAEILAEIAAARPDVGIITIAPELDGAIDLIRELVAHEHHVSLGHSGATYEQAMEGVRAGARQATHLFNRMTPIGHRAPGLAGAMLESSDVIAELICDGIHVHAGMMRVALAAKGAEGIMAITDATAGAG